MDSQFPEPEPRGFLDPPRRDPPTAVGTATPEPSPEPPHHPVRYRKSVLLAVLQSIFRAVEDVGRMVKHVLR